MNCGSVHVIFLLGFFLLAVVFNNTKCNSFAKTEKNLKMHRSNFMSAHLLFFCILFCMTTTMFWTVTKCIQKSDKRCFSEKHFRYSLKQGDGIILGSLKEKCRFSKWKDEFGLRKVLDSLTEKCSISKSIEDLGLKSRRRFPYLYELRQHSVQKYTVLPASLQQYFRERIDNGNNEDLMKYEWARLRSFCTFPSDSPVSSLRLAQNGFYYTENGDKVKCFSCGIEYQGWTDKDIVTDIHSRLSRHCPFLTGADKTNISIHSDEVDGATGFAEESREASSASNDGELFVQKQCRQSSGKDRTASPKRRQHKHPDFESFQRRMETYTKWTCSEIIEPFVLADAGFFYAGFSDCVRCFSCGGGLRNWEYGDGPWDEHERWFPDCSFVNQRKSQGIITQHKETQGDVDDSGSNTSTKRNNAQTDIFKSDDTLQDPVVLKEENAKLKDQLICKICMDSQANVVFTPCGHMVSCQSCAPNIRTCAICRKGIEGRIKAFMG